MYFPETDECTCFYYLNETNHIFFDGKSHYILKICKKCGEIYIVEMNQYDYANKFLIEVAERIGIRKFYKDAISLQSLKSLITAHGDKFYGYQFSWEKNNIPFNHGVILGLLCYTRLFENECFIYNDKNEYIDSGKWVSNNYNKFSEYFDKFPYINIKGY